MAMGLVLKERGVTEVAMESTGVYWKPVYNVWSKMGIRCTVDNARTMRNVPGRKADMSDSHWIAQLHRFGLIKASFIPEDKFQQLKLLSRHRTNLTDDLARVKNRAQRILEDGNIKIGSVVSDVFGVAGLNVLRLIADGMTRADTLAAAVTTNIKRKGEIKKSLTNCFTTNHCFLIKELMQQYDDLNAKILVVDRQLARDVGLLLLKDEIWGLIQLTFFQKFSMNSHRISLKKLKINSILNNQYLYQGICIPRTI